VCDRLSILRAEFRGHTESPLESAHAFLRPIFPGCLQSPRLCVCVTLCVCASVGCLQHGQNVNHGISDTHSLALARACLSYFQSHEKEPRSFDEGGGAGGAGGAEGGGGVLFTKEGVQIRDNDAQAAHNPRSPDSTHTLYKASTGV
jgi:hypothetical protein